jgi:serine/threonine-protein kinase
MGESPSTQNSGENAQESAALPDPWRLVGKQFDGGIDVEAVIGVGGFGTVYRGFHRHFRAPIALKVLRCPDDLSASQRKDLLERFEQETVVLFRLSRLTLDVASCLAAGTFLSATGEKTPYIVQEWLNGRTLDEVLRNEGASLRFGLKDAIRLLSGAARALCVAHDQRIIHRDIKPSNVFVITRDGQPDSKLLDFGIAKVVQRDVADEQRQPARTEGFRFLSVEYAAPEQWDETLGVPSAKTDVFSFALVLVEMLCGGPPLRGSNPNALMFAAMNPSRRPSPRNQGAEIPDEIEELFIRALAVSPEERPSSLADWWQSLADAAQKYADWSSHAPDLTPESAREQKTETPPTAPGVAASNQGIREGTTQTEADASGGAGTDAAPPSFDEFYDRGEALTREAIRHHRRRIGVWVTSASVGAGAVLLAFATWMNGRTSLTVSQTRGALSPGVPAVLGRPLESNPSNDSSALDPEEPASAETESVQTGSPDTELLQTGLERREQDTSPSAAEVSGLSSLSTTPPAAAADGVDVVAPTTERADPVVPRKVRSLTNREPEAKRVAVFEPLNPVAKSAQSVTGELRLNSIPPSAIVIDGRPIGSTPKANVHLSPGSHNVTFVHPELGKRKLLVLVEPGKSQTLSVKF